MLTFDLSKLRRAARQTPASHPPHRYGFPQPRVIVGSTQDSRALESSSPASDQPRVETGSTTANFSGR